MAFGEVTEPAPRIGRQFMAEPEPPITEEDHYLVSRIGALREDVREHFEYNRIVHDQTCAVEVSVNVRIT